MTLDMTLTPDQQITVGLWILGLMSTVITAIVYHIGNAGSSMKKQLYNHGERIAKVEVATANLESAAHRIEDGQKSMGEKLDRLIERK